MTKRTVYARHRDKAALFRASVQRAIERYTVPIEDLRQDECEDLEDTLRAVARRRIGHVLSPVGVRLQRIVSAESYRFPDIFNASFEQSAMPMITFLAEVLSRHQQAGTVCVDDPHRAAIGFMSFVVGGASRLAVSGASIPQEEIEERVRFSVRLFLRGALVRPEAGE